MSGFANLFFPWRKGLAEAQEGMSGFLVRKHHIEILSDTGGHKRPLLHSCTSLTDSENRGLLQRRLDQRFWEQGHCTNIDLCLLHVEYVSCQGSVWHCFFIRRNPNPAFFIVIWSSLVYPTVIQQSAMILEPLAKYTIDCSCATKLLF